MPRIRLGVTVDKLLAELLIFMQRLKLCLRAFRCHPEIGIYDIAALEAFAAFKLAFPILANHR